MTVEELIKELEKYPKDSRVYDECIDEIREIIPIHNYVTNKADVMLKTYYGNESLEEWE